ncbi:MerR family transcriptional regulator [Gracilibacillus oryzae]|uniref:MerR family transcriptional regulator n=1 Tax=Gracilibacillus oryzae TaxID=1672701 RepID=A0A7C8GQM0_9BACI|nr:MerR family transcriptional regulator [Gracilibacillus oryzae]KAB8125759.1 MerR family transcriptional regulator [Gracilibacillus oryzae]
MRGDKIGKVYKIGELAKRTKLSKRTIDYYTKIGLLECVRSDSNYRLYKEEVVAELQFIEKCKQLHLPLEQIKQKMRTNCLDKQKFIEQTEQITATMSVLQNELEEVYSWLDTVEQDEKAEMKRRIQSQSADLMKTLVLFSN